jgi:hypothetical protein
MINRRNPIFYLVKEAFMSEESHSKSTKSQGDVSDEWQNLGQNLKDIFQGAWESDERLKLQESIEAGLEDFASSVNKAVEEFKESPTGQQLKSDVADFQEKVKSGEVEGRAREELAVVLRSINAELEKVSKPRYQTSDTEEEKAEES